MTAHRSDKRLFGETSLYLMCNFPYIFRCKFGISDRPDVRRSFVDKTTRGDVVKFVEIRTTYGHAKETFVHALYYVFNRPFRKGSGRTEWFSNVSPIVGCAVWYFAPDAPVLIKALAFVTPFIWLDGLMWIALFLCLDLAVIAGIGIGVGYWVLNS